MSSALTFGVYLYRTAPASTPGQEDPVDLTDRLLADQAGASNPAVYRDLLSFRTRDVTVAFDNADGYMTYLFQSFGLTDRWWIEIDRGGVNMFRGLLLGLGSVKFDKSERNCEVTAYG